MGLLRMGPPVKLIIRLAAEFAIKNFVETGTYSGGTAVWASEYFSKVLTIEYSKELYEEAIRKFNHISNIEFIFGHSSTELSKLVEQLEGTSIFWLDAHWSGGLTYGDKDECPLIEEIKIINRSKFENFILIDDARLFTSPPPPPHQIEQWPNITTVINALQSGNSDKYIVIIEDVIIAVPVFAKSSVAYYCQEINAEASDAYAKQIQSSNIKKGIELIYQDIKSSKRIMSRLKSLTKLVISNRNFS